MSSRPVKKRRAASRSKPVEEEHPLTEGGRLAPVQPAAPSRRARGRGGANSRQGKAKRKADTIKEEALGSDDDTDNELPVGKTKGRRKIVIQYIPDRNRRHITFSKRKTGIMKKAYELSTLTGTEILLVIASETGHVYTYATDKMKPLIDSPAGRQFFKERMDNDDDKSHTVGEGSSSGGTSQPEQQRQTPHRQEGPTSVPMPVIASQYPQFYFEPSRGTPLQVAGGSSGTAPQPKMRVAPQILQQPPGGAPAMFFPPPTAMQAPVLQPGVTQSSEKTPMNGTGSEQSIFIQPPVVQQQAMGSLWGASPSVGAAGSFYLPSPAFGAEAQRGGSAMQHLSVQTPGSGSELHHPVVTDASAIGKGEPAAIQQSGVSESSFRGRRSSLNALTIAATAGSYQSSSSKTKPLEKGTIIPGSATTAAATRPSPEANFASATSAVPAQNRPLPQVLMGAVQQQGHGTAPFRHIQSGVGTAPPPQVAPGQMAAAYMLAEMPMVGQIRQAPAQAVPPPQVAAQPAAPISTNPNQNTNPAGGGESQSRAQS